MTDKEALIEIFNIAHTHTDDGTLSNQIKKAEAHNAELVKEMAVLKQNDAYELSLPPEKRTICKGCSLPADVQKIDATLKMEFLSSDNLRVDVKDLKRDLSKASAELDRIKALTKEQIADAIYYDYDTSIHVSETVNALYKLIKGEAV